MRGIGFTRMAAVAAVLLVVGAGAAWASGLTNLGFVGTDGTITACVQNDNGRVRFIDSASSKKNVQSCKSTETQVQFDQQGPQGPQGPPGVTPGPENVTVDCSAGDSLQQALDSHPEASSLNITIDGTCTESVSIFRDNVTLTAGTPGAGIQAPSSGEVVLSIPGKEGIALDGVTLSGGRVGIDAYFGASFQTNDLHIVGAQTGVQLGNSSAGAFDQALIEDSARDAIDLFGSGSAEVIGGTISGSGSNGICACGGGSIDLQGTVVTGSGFAGLAAHDGGTIQASGVTVQNTTGTGVDAFDGGSVSLQEGTVVEGSTTSGVVAQTGGSVDLNQVDVKDNADSGVLGYNGGRVVIQGGPSTTIEHNGGDGVELQIGSTAAIGGFVQDNGGDGLHLHDNSVAQVQNGSQITGNTGWGIFCEPGGSAVLSIVTPSPLPSGNAAGQDNCPVAP